MAYNTSWMNNATTIVDAVQGGLNTSVTGSTLAITNVGFLVLISFFIMSVVSLNKRLDSIENSFIISGFVFLVIGVLFSIIGIYGIYWNGLFLVSIVGGLLYKAFN
jgi:hypothetical protein